MKKDENYLKKYFLMKNKKKIFLQVVIQRLLLLLLLRIKIVAQVVGVVETHDVGWG